MRDPDADDPEVRSDRLQEQVEEDAQLLMSVGAAEGRAQPRDEDDGLAPVLRRGGSLVVDEGFVERRQPVDQPEPNLQVADQVHQGESLFALLKGKEKTTLMFSSSTVCATKKSSERTTAIPS